MNTITLTVDKKQLDALKNLKNLADNLKSCEEWDLLLCTRIFENDGKRFEQKIVFSTSNILALKELQLP